jgi:hypothetical protein
MKYDTTIYHVEKDTHLNSYEYWPWTLSRKSDFESQIKWRNVLREENKMFFILNLWVFSFLFSYTTVLL